ncbi:MAG: TniQ family protein [Candidatus Competibacteraceae bacterium]|nr:TniQ family protein [Candidatus Competibacteraceae bacterium]
MTSYLARTAHLHGLNAYRFFAFHLPDLPIWNRDFDRTASSEGLKRVAALLGVSEEEVVAMTLKPYARHLAGDGTGDGAVQPWVNAAGIYHRVRRRHALQFCPRCLQAEPAFKRFWRLSFVVACDRHRCLLRDACAVCGAPVVPHRANVSIVGCYHCGSRLPKAPVEPHPFAVDQVLTVQSRLLDAVKSGVFDLRSTTIRATEFFRGLRMLLLLARERIRFTPQAAPELCGLPPYRLELMRAYDRVAIIALIGRHLLADFDALAAFLGNLGMTRAQFLRFGRLPDWLWDAVLSLPPGRAPRRSSARSLQRELVRIRAERSPGWRDRHAQLLMDWVGATHGR